ncbi:MAG: tetratricopeptide repeat protein [Henriciella sp.]
MSVILETALELPNWFDSVIVSTLLLGFPVALLLAWAFEITPEGVKRTSADAEADSEAMRGVDFVVIGGLALVTGLIGWQLTTMGGERSPDERAPAIEAEPETIAERNLPTDPELASIAVLPFADLSAEGDQDFFSDGISEEILNVLSRVDGLKVASRTSAFQFKTRSDVSIPEIAVELGVAHVLEGSVRKAGENVRITAQLIKAGSDEHLWSGTFDRELTVESIFQIQDEIATGIVSQLGEQMDLGRANTLRFAAAADTQNLRAYEAYLEGRDLLSQRNGETLPDIIASFQLATELDPDFARAWEALAAAYNVAPAYSLANPDPQDFPAKSKAAAEAALAIDDQLPLAIAISSGVGQESGKPDFAVWLASIDAGLAVDPNEAVLIGWRGQYLTSLGYFEQAERDLRQALELDPADEISAGWLVRNLILQRRLEEAYELFRTRADLSESNGQLRGMVALVLAADGRMDEAVGLMEEGSPPGIDIERMKVAYFEPVDDPDQALQDFLAALGPFAQFLESLDEMPGDLLHNFGDYARITVSNSRSWDLVVWLYHRPEFLQSPDRYRLMDELGLEAYWRTNGLPPQCRSIETLPDGRDYMCE